MLVRQLGIDEVPLGLERATEDGIAGFLGRRFQRIEGRRGLQGGDISGREVEGRKLGHPVGGGIVDAADQHANMAHEVLLGQDNSRMLPQQAAARLGLDPTLIRASQVAEMAVFLHNQPSLLLRLRRLKSL